MARADIRKLATFVDEIHEEAGRAISPPMRRAAAVAVIANPFAGQFGEDLSDLMEIGAELEHAAAILHPKLGAPLRAAVEKGVALVPSSKKRGGPGRVLDIPLGHKDAAYVRSHFDGMEVSLSDAPRADEILVAIAVTDFGRPLPRVGCLTAAEAEGKDGLR